MSRLHRLKGCPRCGGDLFSEEDPWSTYVACWQCGHIESEEEKSDPRRLLNEANEGPLSGAGKRRSPRRKGGSEEAVDGCKAAR